MIKKTLLLFLVLCTFFSLSALNEGRIKINKIPSLTSEISLEKSEFLYNAPLMEYINLNFGLMVNKWTQPGLSFGIDFQWIDSKHVAGTIRANMIFLTNRSMDRIYLGGYANASICAGVPVAGFKGVVYSMVKAAPGNDPIVSLELQPGVYISPHESVNLFFAPAIGKYFVKSDSFFFNLIVSLEVFLWK